MERNASRDAGLFPEITIFGGWGKPSWAADQARRTRRGVNHRSVIIPPDPLPDQAVDVVVSISGTYDQVSLYYTTDGSDPQGSRGRATHGTSIPLAYERTEWHDLMWEYLDWWRGQIPPQAKGTKVKYKIEAWHSRGGCSVYADNQVSDSTLATVFAYLVDELRPPEWVRDSIIYHIFIDRFYPGNHPPGFRSLTSPSDFYGGTIRGVIDKLDYLVNLGVNCLWLSPCFPSTSYHGYDVTDYLTVEPRLGSETDLRNLIKLAHEAGLHVILDFVANHTSWKHPFFVEAQAGRDSVYYNWYTFTHWPNEYKAFFGVKTLPQLNTENQEVRDYIIRQVAIHWLNTYDVDGFRLDSAAGPSHSFWVDFAEMVKNTRPESVHIGEVIENPDSWRSYEGRLDGCLDFLFMRAAREYFALGQLDAEQFDSFITHHESYFADYFLRPTFLDNHDVDRFLWLAREDTRRLKLAALCQFTLPQPPIIYYGTEVGLSQERGIGMPNGREEHGYARQPMLWGEEQDRDLHSHYKKLCAMRHAHRALRRGVRKTVCVDKIAGTYAYALQDPDETILVILNNSERQAWLQIPTTSVGLADGMALRNFLGEDIYVVEEGRVKISLEPFSGIVLGCSR
ncbi:MAG: glycoside hydrolase family 13 protein [Chloroflexi bacterium]|nr:glycoside hydrolase family 13 protein [Chloroflexota bacterium]